MSKLNCSGAPAYSNAFYRTSIQEAKLGKDFSFGKSELPASGTWYKEGSSKQYTASELAKEYDGTTMSGTYMLNSECEYIAQNFRPSSYGNSTYKNIFDAKTSLPVGYAYCTNQHISFGSTQQYCNSYGVTSDNEYLKWLDPNYETNRDSSINLYEAVLTALYYGFGNVNGTLPNTDKSLQEACEIDDSSAAAIMQDVIWYYSDGSDYYNYYNTLGGGEAKYYAALTGRSSEYNLTYDSIPDADKLKLEVLSVDDKVGNYQNLIMLTLAKYSQDIDGNKTDDSNDDSNGTNNSSNSSDNNKSSQVNAQDYSSSSDSAANTGDNTNIALLFVLMAIAMAGIVATVVITIRNRKYNN